MDGVVAFIEPLFHIVPLFLSALVENVGDRRINKGIIDVFHACRDHNCLEVGTFRKGAAANAYQILRQGNTTQVPAALKCAVDQICNSGRNSHFGIISAFENHLIQSGHGRRHNEAAFGIFVYIVQLGNILVVYRAVNDHIVGDAGAEYDVQALVPLDIVNQVGHIGNRVGHCMLTCLACGDEEQLGDGLIVNNAVHALKVGILAADHNFLQVLCPDHILPVAAGDALAQGDLPGNRTAEDIVAQLCHGIANHDFLCVKHRAAQVFHCDNRIAVQSLGDHQYFVGADAVVDDCLAVVDQIFESTLPDTVGDGDGNIGLFTDHRDLQGVGVAHFHPVVVTAVVFGGNVVIRAVITEMRAGAVNLGAISQLNSVGHFALPVILEPLYITDALDPVFIPPAIVFGFHNHGVGGNAYDGTRLNGDGNGIGVAQDLYFHLIGFFGDPGIIFLILVRVTDRESHSLIGNGCSIDGDDCSVCKGDRAGETIPPGIDRDATHHHMLVIHVLFHNDGGNVDCLDIHADYFDAVACCAIKLSSLQIIGLSSRKLSGKHKVAISGLVIGISQLQHIFIIQITLGVAISLIEGEEYIGAVFFRCEGKEDAGIAFRKLHRVIRIRDDLLCLGILNRYAYLFVIAYNNQLRGIGVAHCPRILIGLVIIPAQPVYLTLVDKLSDFNGSGGAILEGHCAGDMIPPVVTVVFVVSFAGFLVPAAVPATVLSIDNGNGIDLKIYNQSVFNGDIGICGIIERAQFRCVGAYIPLIVIGLLVLRLQPDIPIPVGKASVYNGSGGAVHKGHRAGDLLTGIPLVMEVSGCRFAGFFIPVAGPPAVLLFVHHNGVELNICDGRSDNGYAYRLITAPNRNLLDIGIACRPPIVIGLIIRIIQPVFLTLVGKVSVYNRGGGAVLEGHCAINIIPPIVTEVEICPLAGFFIPVILPPAVIFLDHNNGIDLDIHNQRIFQDHIYRSGIIQHNNFCRVGAYIPLILKGLLVGPLHIIVAVTVVKLCVYDGGGGAVLEGHRAVDLFIVIPIVMEPVTQPVVVFIILALPPAVFLFDQGNGIKLNAGDGCGFNDHACITCIIQRSKFRCVSACCPLVIQVLIVLRFQQVLIVTIGKPSVIDGGGRAILEGHCAIDSIAPIIIVVATQPFAVFIISAAPFVVQLLVHNHRLQLNIRNGCSFNSYAYLFGIVQCSGFHRIGTHRPLIVIGLVVLILQPVFLSPVGKAAVGNGSGRAVLKDHLTGNTILPVVMVEFLPLAGFLIPATAPTIIHALIHHDGIDLNLFDGGGDHGYACLPIAALGRYLYRIGVTHRPGIFFGLVIVKSQTVSLVLVGKVSVHNGGGGAVLEGHCACDIIIPLVIEVGSYPFAGLFIPAILPTAVIFLDHGNGIQLDICDQRIFDGHFYFCGVIQRVKLLRVGADRPLILIGLLFLIAHPLCGALVGKMSVFNGGSGAVHKGHRAVDIIIPIVEKVAIPFAGLLIIIAVIPAALLFEQHDGIELNIRDGGGHNGDADRRGIAHSRHRCGIGVTHRPGILGELFIPITQIVILSLVGKISVGNGRSGTVFEGHCAVDIVVPLIVEIRKIFAGFLIPAVGLIAVLSLNDINRIDVNAGDGASPQNNGICTRFTVSTNPIEIGLTGFHLAFQLEIQTITIIIIGQLVACSIVYIPIRVAFFCLAFQDIRAGFRRGEGKVYIFPTGNGYILRRIQLQRSRPRGFRKRFSIGHNAHCRHKQCQQQEYAKHPYKTFHNVSSPFLPMMLRGVCICLIGYLLRNSRFPLPGRHR